MVSLIGGSNINAMEVRLAGDATDLNSTLDDAAMAVSAFKAQVAAMGTTMAIVSGGAMAGATAVAERWNETQREMTKVTNPEVAQELGDSIREMSRDIPVATNELGRLAASAARFGVDGQENIEAFVRSVAKMASATQLSTEQAGESFAKLAELTNTPIPKVENLGSSIAELENNMATSAQEIVKNALRSSATLSNMGLAAPEILGLSAAINEVSHSARRAGTALRRVSQDMMNPQKAKDFANALGMTKEEFVEMRNNNPKETLLALVQTMKEGGKGANVLKKEMTSLTRRGLSKLAQNTEGVNEALEISKTQFRENTALQREYRIQTDSLTADLKKLKNSIEDTAITIGNVFVPYVREAIAAITPALDAFNDWVKETEGVKAAMALAATFTLGLATALGAIAQIGPPVTAIMYGMAVATGSIYATMAPLVGLVTALGYAWKTNFAGIKESTMAVASVLKTQFMATLRSFVALSQTILGTFSDSWGRHASAVETALADIIKYLEGSFISGIRTTGKSVRRFLHQMRFWWIAHGDKAIDAVASYLQEIHRLFESGFNLILFTINGRTAEAQTSYKNFLDALTNATKTTMGGLWKIYEAAVLKIKSQLSGTGIIPLWKNTLAKIRNFTAIILAAIGLIWKRKWGELKSLVQSTMKQVQSTMKKTGSKLKGIAQRTSRKAFLAYQKASQTTVSKTKKIWANLPPGIKKAIQPIINVFNKHKGKLREMSNSVKSITNKLAGYWNRHKSKVYAVLITIAQGISQKYARTVDLLVKGVNKGLKKIDKALTTHKGKINSTINKANSKFQKYKAQVKLAVAGIVTAFSLLTGIAPMIFFAVSMVAMFEGETIGTFKRIRQTINSEMTNIKATMRNAFNIITKNIVKPSLKFIENLWRKHKQSILTIGRTFTKLLKSISLSLVKVWKKNIGKLPIIARTTMKLIGLSIKVGLGLLIPIFRTTLNNILSMWRAWDTQLVGIANSLITLLVGIYRAGVTVLENIWKRHGKSIVNTVRRSMNTLLGIVRGVMKALLQIVNPILKRLVVFWRQNKKSIMTIVRALGGFLITFFTATTNNLLNIIKPTLNFIGKLWKMFGDEIVAATRFAFDLILSVIGAALDTLASLIKATTALINGRWKKALKIMQGNLRRIFNGIISFVAKWSKGLVNHIVNALRNVIQTFIDFGKRLIFGSIVKDIFNAITQFIKSSLNNLASTIGNIINGIKQTIQSAFNAVKSTIQGAISTIKSTIVDGFQSATSSAVSALNGLKGKVSSIAGSIVSSFESAMSTISGIASDIVSTARGAMQSAGSYLSDAQSAAEDAVDAAADAAEAAADAATNGARASDAANGPSGTAVGDVSDLEDVNPRSGGDDDDDDDTHDRGRQGYGLAAGGIVTGPTQAVIGEGGDDEAVIPLNQRGKAMLADAVGSGGNGGGITIEEVKVVASTYADGEQAARGFKDELRSHNFD